MFTDAFLQLDSANALIRAAGTYVSTNTIDLSQNRDIGSGAPLRVLYNVDVAFAGGTSVQPQVITSASANLSSPTVIDLGTLILTAALTLGAMFVRFVPELTGPSGIGTTGQRYLGVQYVSLGTYTLGSISCRIVNDVLDVKHYPSGYVIL
jgi:hypothetical protein